MVRCDLNAIYRLSAMGGYDEALDLIFEWFDNAAYAGDFDAIDRTLAQVDVSSLCANTAVGFVTATYPARDRLSARDDVVKRVRARLLALGRDPGGLS